MNRFLKHLGNAIFIGTLIYFVFLAIFFFMGRFDEGFSYDRALQEYYRNMIYSLILYMVNAYWMQYLIVKHKKHILAKRPMLVGITGNIILSLIGIFISRFILKVGLDNMALSDFLRGERLEYYKVSMLIAIIISIIFYVAWHFKYKQENKVKEQKIIAGTASAKFDALKNQLDPHFLFNSLNVLTSLIEEDPVQAQKFTTSLSKVYRYVLEQKNKDLVTVDEELSFAKTYIKLLRMRFENSIVLDIPAESSNPEAKIVPLSLQLLLENAVKHNVVTASRPLKIRVYEEGGMLCVSNNYQEKRMVKKSSGVGLKNIQQRYQILSKREVEIVKSDSEFTVRLPLLTEILNNFETQELIIEDKRYKKAKERVEALKSFYGNLGAYIVVIPILAVLNYNTTSFPWAIFPALGWGFGVVMHGLDAYGRAPILGKGWEERTMRKLMEDDDF
ncbi:histidine kinase [Arenibacter latericius]|uniref:histidine kinase n=1 Tax=Arenibacter latericius TaxID=86104 RepID=UPI000400E51F|nr:2TM domain-containing protein [Arenibacter latericius]MDX1364455.1 histidine kinase [Arenibacter latericius]